jgi:hypothetical protein
MSKRKNKKNEEEFENIFANADFNDEFGEEDGLFDDENFQDEEYDEEDYQEEYGEEQQLPMQPEENTSGIISTVGNVANLAKENKLATAGILGAVGFGLWKVLGGKEEGSPNAPQQTQGSVPQSYDDEFLGLDEEDSIDEFIDQNRSQKINPMFTPLRFK